MHSFQVLLVEDEPLLCRIIKETLHVQGFRVKTAQRGKDALELLNTESFDLMVLDVRLPDMSGLQVLESAKQRDDSLRVLLVTAYESEITFALPPVKQVEAILFKPFDIDMLFSTVRQLIRNILMEPNTNITTSRLPNKYRSVPPLQHTVVSLQTIPPADSQAAARTYAGRVLDGNKTAFSVLTAPAEETADRVQVEYGETNAYYRFQAGVEEVNHQECSSVWLLGRPAEVQQLQRRKHPRLPAHGHVQLLPASQRVLRVIQGELLDISEGGMRIRTSHGLSKGMHLQAMVEWQDDEQVHVFDTSGVVMHGFGHVQDGEMVFELGIAVERMPSTECNPIRAKLKE